MKLNGKRFVIILLKRSAAGYLAAMMVLMACQAAHAALGGAADTIAADRTALRAVQRGATSRSGYRVEEIAADATNIREYVSPAGIVFGIAWDGYVHPDLTQILGTYWQEYSTARHQAARKAGSRRQQLTTGNMVIETWGHMRNLRVRAYVPDLLPNGVSIEQIK